MWPAIAASAGASLLGSLFSSGGDDVDVKTEMVDLLTPKQQTVLNKILNLVGGQIGQGVTPYKKPTVAGVSPLLEQYFQGVQDYGTSPLYTGGAGVLERAMQPYDPTAAREYWETAFYDPAMRKFQLDVMPQLKEDIAGMGGYSSGGALTKTGRAYGDVYSGLTSQLANILYSGQQSALDRSMQAAGMAPDYAAAPLALLGEAGTQQRDIQNQLLQANYQKWLSKQAYNNPWLQYLMPTVGMQTQQPVSYIEQQTPWYGQLGQSLMGAGQMGLGLGLGKGFANWLG